MRHYANYVGYAQMPDCLLCSINEGSKERLYVSGKEGSSFLAKSLGEVLML